MLRAGNMISGAISRAYKTELELNNGQITACKRHAGAARFAYHWALQHKQEVYKATQHRPSAVELHRELNALKKTELPWLYAVSKCAPQEALRNLDAAFAHFFRRCKLKQEGKGKLGYPHAKTKNKGLGSFRLTGTIVVCPDAIQLPRLGRLRLKEHGYLPVTGTPTPQSCRPPSRSRRDTGTCRSGCSRNGSCPPTKARRWAFIWT